MEPTCEAHPDLEAKGPATDKDVLDKALVSVEPPTKKMKSEGWTLPEAPAASKEAPKKGPQANQKEDPKEDPEANRKEDSKEDPEANRKEKPTALSEDLPIPEGLASGSDISPLSSRSEDPLGDKRTIPEAAALRPLKKLKQIESLMKPKYIKKQLEMDDPSGAIHHVTWPVAHVPL